MVENITKDNWWRYGLRANKSEVERSAQLSRTKDAIRRRRMLVGTCTVVRGIAAKFVCFPDKQSDFFVGRNQDALKFNAFPVVREAIKLFFI